MPRQRQRQFQTTITYDGYAYTRSYSGRHRDTYRCSVYRSRSCRARLTVLKDGNRIRAGTITLIDRHTCDASSRLTPRRVNADSRAPSDVLSPSSQLSLPTSQQPQLSYEASTPPLFTSDDEHDMSDVEPDVSFDYEPDDGITRSTSQGSHSANVDDMRDSDGFSDDDIDDVSRGVQSLMSQPVMSQPVIGACLNGGSRVYADDFEEEFIEVIDAQPLMEKETDRLAILFPDKTASEIWDIIHEDFYAHHTNEIRRGLTKDQVIKRVYRARNVHFGGDDPISRLERAPLAFVSGSQQPFLQFNHAFYERDQLHRVIGWAHPALLRLLNYKQTALFVDGTFKSVPKAFYQCLVIMVYDEASDLYVPVFHVLVTGKSEAVYQRALTCVKAATGGKMDPATVTCDFEQALHNAVKSHFADASLVGCFFHWKQAIRRWLLKSKMPEDEVEVALSPGFVDRLTMTPHHLIETKAIPWIKQRLASSCRRKKIGYSEAIWEKFWVYFRSTWIVRFPPSSWNYTKIPGAIVNRTNNPLERYNRKLNSLFVGAHPNLATFVTKIEEEARKIHRNILDIQAGRASAPSHAAPYIPAPISFN